jgi:hypothetical protein
MKSDTIFCSLGYLLLVCKISAQYVNFYLVFIDSEKNNFSVDVYVHLAVSLIATSTVYCVILLCKRIIKKKRFYVVG